MNALNVRISGGSLIRFALPTIVSMVFMGIYTTVDGIFVSRLVGTDALSAVNITMPLINVAIALGTMFGTGGSAIVARKMGEGKDGEARSDFTFIACVSAVSGIAMAALCLVFLQPLLNFLGASERIYGYCRDYAAWSMYFAPILVVSMALQVFFIAAGRAKLGLYLSIAGGLSNIVLDYAFIVVIPMGIKGAALATGLGYALSGACSILFFAFSRRAPLRFVRPGFDFRMLRGCMSNGASEMVTNLSMAVVTLFLNNTMMRLAGEDGVAAITILLYAQMLLSSFYIGYAMGIAPIVSFHYGRGDASSLRKLFRVSQITIVVASGATLLASLGLADVLVRVFAPVGSTVYDMAVGGFRLFAISFAFMGVNVVASALFTALSDGRSSAILSFMRTLVFVVGAATLLPGILGLNGVWLAIPVAEALSFVMTLCFFRACLPRYLRPAYSMTSSTGQ